MTETKDFNAYTCDLTGSHLISAGAGTGKTYTIQLLYLRMILSGMPSDKILVVTFTKLATQELQHRLRKILNEMLDALTDKTRITEQIRPFFDLPEFNNPQDAATLQSRVTTALMQFDQAPISTIHGFCERLMREHAFESNLRFRLSLHEDVKSKRKAVMSDYWRSMTSNEEKADSEVLRLRRDVLSRAEKTPDALLKDLNDVFRDEQASINWGKDTENITLRDWEAAHVSSGRELTDEERALYLRLLQKDAFETVWKELEKQKLRDGEITFNDLIGRVHACLKPKLSSGAAEQEIPEKNSFVKAIQDSYKVALVDEYQDTDPAQNDIFQDLFAVFSTNSEETKERGFFMIGDPKQAIYGFRGGDVESFMKASEAKELEEGTLSTNYRSSDAYIDALNEFYGKFPGFFTLNETGKQRITARAIKRPFGNNKLFHSMPSEFLLGRMSGKIRDMAKDIKRLAECGKFSLTGTAGQEAKTVPLHYRDMAVLVNRKATGEEVQAALRAEHIPAVFVDDRSVLTMIDVVEPMCYLLRVLCEPGDSGKIQWLFGSSWFGMTAKELAEFHDSSEKKAQAIQAFQVLLKKATHESFSAAVRHMLMMPVQSFGMTENEANASKKETVSSRMIRMQGEAGVTMLARFRQMTETLQAMSDERHLGVAGLRGELETIYNTLRWKSFGHDQEEHLNTVDDNEAENEKERIWMPTEGDAVRIMTVHKSKGLEFPLVFVPSFSSSKGKRFPERRYHDSGAGNKRYIDMSPELNPDAVREAQEEQRRLMYVAMTRARYLCWFYTGNIRNKVPLTPEGEPVSGKPAAAESERLEFEKEHPEFLLNPLKPLEETALKGTPQAESVEDKPAQAAPPPVAQEAAVTKSDLFPGWVQTSFSMLSRHVSTGTAGSTAVSEEPAGEPAVSEEPAGEPAVSDLKDDEPGEVDEDAAGRLMSVGAVVPMSARRGMFVFPGGKRTGTCWHKVFEELDYTKTAKEQEERIVGTLRRYGQLGKDEKERIDSFLSAVEDVRTRALTPVERWGERNNQPGETRSFAPVRLCDACSTAREWVFTYHLRPDAETKSLSEVLQAYGVPMPEGWERHVSREWVITGSIDLLFEAGEEAVRKVYLIDWKSNLIGGSIESFDADGVAAEMMRSAYHLQYLIYTVAFVQYARSLTGTWGEAEYGKQFGGCFHVFLRGFGDTAHRDAGVYAARPCWGLIEKLEEILGAVKREETQA